MSVLNPHSFSTETLLRHNPVELVPDPQSGREIAEYVILVKENQLHIGALCVVFDDTHKELLNPRIPELDGLGFGVATYVAAARLRSHDGRLLPLRSGAPSVSRSANRVWESLVRRGLAVCIDAESRDYEWTAEL